MIAPAQHGPTLATTDMPDCCRLDVELSDGEFQRDAHGMLHVVYTCPKCGARYVRTAQGYQRYGQQQEDRP